MIDKRLAHYQINAKLGAGGMGDVYKARDTRLDREVALKILPEQMASDPERRVRFEREAKAVAALKHPNIVTIHAVEEADGHHFIAMELVSGDTLSDRLASGPLSLERFFDIAVPLTDAITSAHHKGITHRDLKPANIMFEENGQLKVLDFGLAKLAEEPVGADAMTVGPDSATKEGQILGTVAYMSPEQAEGKPVDARTDVFAMGVIFFQMITGDLPFKGDTNMSTLAAILREEPPSVTDIQKSVPRYMGRIIKRCLSKDPDRRYQSAHELRNDLLELKDEMASGEISAGEGPVSTAAVKGGASNKLWMGLAGAAVLAAVVFGAMQFLGKGEKAAVAPPTPSMEMVRLTSTGKSLDAAISPNGRYVAHIIMDEGERSLWVTQVSTSSSVEIVKSTEDVLWDPAFSPDGDFIYFCRSKRRTAVTELYKIPVLGGQPRKIIEDINTTVSFSPDGSRFAFVRSSPATGQTQLVTAKAEGSDEQVLAVKDIPLNFVENPSWSPDGRVLVVSVISIGDGVNSWLAEFDAETGEEKRLTSGSWFQIGEVAWMPDGKALVATVNENPMTSQIYEFSYPSGNARRITSDVNVYEGLGVTADGSTIAAGMDESYFNIWILNADGSGQPKRVTQGASRSDGVGVWTTDNQLLFGSDGDGSAQIWRVNVDGSNMTKLTSGDLNVDPSVAPGGKEVAFISTRGDGKIHLWKMDLDGGNPVQLTFGTFEVNPRVSPDGQWLAFMGGVGQSLFRMPMEGGEPTPLTSVRTSNHEISPDGNLISYRAFDPQAGRGRTYIIPAEGGDPIQVLDTPSGNCKWTPDGRALTYSDVVEGVGNLWNQPLDEGEPVQLTFFTEDVIGNFAWSPDGRQLAVSRGNTTSDVVLLKKFR